MLRLLIHFIHILFRASGNPAPLVFAHLKLLRILPLSSRIKSVLIKVNKFVYFCRVERNKLNTDEKGNEILSMNNIGLIVVSVIEE